MNRTGFTLIELLIVLAILAIISLIAVPNFLGLTEKAREKAALYDCSECVRVTNVLIITENENTSNISTSDIENMSNVSGSIESTEFFDSELTHLRYEVYDYVVTYCKYYKTCSYHEKEYNLEKKDNDLSSENFLFFSINSEKIQVKGDLATYEVAQNGETLTIGDVFLYDTKYYLIKDSPFLPENFDASSFIATYGVKINTDEIVVIDGKVKKGDVKYEDGSYYVFAPYSRYKDDYLDKSYWIKLTTINE